MQSECVCIKSHESPRGAAAWKHQCRSGQNDEEAYAIKVISA